MGSKEKRVKIKGNRRTGIVLFAAGLLLVAFGLYLFSRTWGLNLLFTSVWIGRLSRLYWIVILAGAAAALLGAVILKKGKDAGKGGQDVTLLEEPVSEPEKTEPERQKMAAPEPMVSEQAKPEPEKTEPVEEERFCPVCGNRLSARSRFCGKCGTKVE